LQGSGVSPKNTLAQKRETGVARDSNSIPQRQYAVGLTGANRLTLNTEKAIPPVGPHTILTRVEAVGLCFSDLKLLQQFDAHPRKAEIVSGLPQEALDEMPWYVPGAKPTVPGHEAVCRIVAVGGEVRYYTKGERVLVQADYRTLRTAASNAAFGYNFEGALQEYVAFDERVVTEPKTGERFLMPVGEELSASAVCLVEPWACVEDSYVSPERRGPKAGGRMLVVAESAHKVEGLKEAFAISGAPARVTIVAADEKERETVRALGVATRMATDVAADIAALPDEAFDDVVYFGAKGTTIEALGEKIAKRGIMNIVTGGARIGERVSVAVGRVHYGLTRWVGTAGTSARESYDYIPATAELRAGDRIEVIGAGGPMGQMHVIRALASGVAGLEITATDFDDARLKSLWAKAGPLAEARGIPMHLVNPQRDAPGAAATYVALMAPVAALVAEAIDTGARGLIINIFAGIPVGTRQQIDLDRYIANRCYMAGTSGSVMRDMKIVLEKIQSGQLDTNTSVDAISGMAGAIRGLAAVEHRTLSGKIIVYPWIHDLGLVPLAELAGKLPEVAARLRSGIWTKQAEEELVRIYRR